MAGQLQVVTLAAPGFYGLNTQESGITISNGFALEATNCILDKFGRIGSRKGWVRQSNFVTGKITNITASSSCTVTAPAHGLSRFDQVKIVMPELGGMDELNGNVYYVDPVSLGDEDNFYLCTLDSSGFVPVLNPIDSTNFVPYVFGGDAIELTALTGNVRAIAELTKTDGSLEVLFAADNKLFTLGPDGDPLQLTTRTARIKGPISAGIQATNPAQITTAKPHEFVTGDIVRFEDDVINGVEYPGGPSDLYDTTFTITVIDDTNFTLDGVDGTGWSISTSPTSIAYTSIYVVEPTVTDDDWQIITYNNHAVFVQEGHEPVYYDASPIYVRSYYTYDNAPFTQPTCGAACFNRVWLGEGSTVYWSKILEPQSFTGTGTGFLNVREIFGEDDDVTAITSYNNRLVIFGRRNIAFFAGAEDPTGITFQMVDHIKGIGCIARDSVQNVGTDVVFLSTEGVRTIGRTIQEQSSPIGDVSKNIRDELVQFVAGESEYRIKGVYSPKDAFYLLTLPSTGYTYCFDMRAQLQDGSRRVTLWTNITPSAYCVRKNNDLLLGQYQYVAKYDSYKDNEVTYRLSYYTNYFDFGNAANESILKKIRLAIIGATKQNAALKWAFDYNIDYNATSFVLSEGTSSEYNEGEYFSDDGINNEAEYSSGIVLDNVALNIGGKGAVVQVGIEADIAGGALSIQKMDIFAKNGKLVS